MIYTATCTCWLYRKVDYINVCIGVIYAQIQYCLLFLSSFCPQRQHWLLEEWEEKNVSPYPLKSFVCFLFCISNGVRTSLCFWRKSNIPWKARRIEGLCLQWGNRFSQRVCFTRLRLTSLWALYTLKWTLVTLVLNGPLLDLWILKAQPVVLYM